MQIVIDAIQCKYSVNKCNMLFVLKVNPLNSGGWSHIIVLSIARIFFAVFNMYQAADFDYYYYYYEFEQTPKYY